ncbi:hypothetical protein BC941DRAFT_419179 [Chlamydoabsidia padenii]|nr:hypothetical protein BC941DRAFT_419179 [Chlamydoabsidia padenii]
MEVDPFVYILYPTPPQPKAVSFSTQRIPISQKQSFHQDDPPAPKRKRQQLGYACDKCRERRVGCDRGKPTCGQCYGKHDCIYSNHALRLDNVSMRQRMDTMQSTIERMYDVLMRLEDDYKSTVPRILGQQQQQQQYSTTTATHQTYPLSPPFIMHNDNNHFEESFCDQDENPTIVDWATTATTRWYVSANNDGSTTIQTDITSYEDLSDAVRRALQMTYGFQGPSLYSPSTLSPDPISVDDVPSFSVFERLGRLPSRFTISNSTTTTTTTTTNSNSSNNCPDHLLETDVMTRLIKQHHQCGFPILVSPSRFERHYQQGEIQSVVLSSIFCHIAPHACIYHPHLVHLQDFRTLGERFYDHSRTELGLDEQEPNVSNIHQRTLLITYDLDLGRVRRAFLHLGVAIRMCFALDLHRPEGYQHYTNAFDREQAKRVFWTVWFYDTMVPHYFAQPSTMRNHNINTELPCVLSDFDPVETDQTRFAISLIHIRRIQSEPSVRAFYKSLPDASRMGRSSSPVGSIWARRSYFCVLLDYCLHWITLYQPRLPRKSAVKKVSQAAFAMLHLFDWWFGTSEHFDCFFRPYLFHYMSIIQVFKDNITQQDGSRSPILIAQSKAALVKLFHMYRQTPTHRSFAESQLEKNLVEFIQRHGILTLSQLYADHHQEPNPSCIDELVDDPEGSDYYGWGIFAVQTGNGSSISGDSSSSSASSMDASIYQPRR